MDNNHMNVMTQFSVFMVDRPGVLSQLCRELASQKINIVAMTVSDSQEHGVMRFVVEDPAGSAQVLNKLNLPMTETDVLGLTLSNRPGAMAEVCEKLAQAHIPIHYAYCTSGARGGRTTGVFKVADIKKAIKTLSANKTPSRQDLIPVKRSPRSRR